VIVLNRYLLRLRLHDDGDDDDHGDDCRRLRAM
jgi:hypothetical protein